MMMENTEIAKVLRDVGTLLEIDGANPFRVRAYENAARTVEPHAVPMRTMVESGAKLTDLPGIGKEMASHIQELVTTGALRVLQDLTREVPYTLVEMVRLPGVGPKRANKLWRELGVETIDQLEAAAKAGAVESLAGFGKKTQERIVRGIASLKKRAGRFRLAHADQLVEPLVEYMRTHEGVRRIEVAGSYRRRMETVGDIDLLVIARDPQPVMDHFTAYERVKKIELASGTSARVMLQSGLQVNLRVLPPASYGAALQYFTGSQAHNVKLRRRAVARGLRVSEDGVFRVPEGEDPDAEDVLSGERVAGASEEDVYAALELAWIPPELREDRGEVEAAAGGKLPELVTLDHMRGDLQMHSTWSDGHDGIDAMVKGCVERGYEYLALTDHSKSLAMTGGLDAEALREQWREIDEVQAAHPEIRILKSQEIDILRDGSLDLADEMIEQLDVVLVSIHSLFDLPAAQQTNRILAAIRHPAVHILAHPTGRLINEREPYQFDLEEVLCCCKENGVAVELNAHPSRLDLKDTQLMRARELGVKIVISTDAHRVRDLDLMHYGVEQARRAWLAPADVLNTRPLQELLGSLET
ncbi:MAG: DNA polymerase/3'-5' exonuclease PolX [Gemmatimonadetes bacterium]|nr:DNA polymerase/3'-5' exonuclease PolX [Gemmatimonadota bacterium]